MSHPSNASLWPVDLASLLPQIVALARLAGQDILRIYESGQIDATQKADDSPLTAADLASHARIVSGLQSITPDIDIVSEEGRVPAAAQAWPGWFWLVDPLDGTKEFLARNGEFTVNIALIHDGVPVLGVVDVPAHSICYWGARGDGAYRQQQDAMPEPIHVRGQRHQQAPLRVMVSKRHMTAETEALIHQWGQHTLVQVGSSLKFCRIAEGQADVYPRLGPTCEWDTAAAQAVVEAAGGQVVTLTGQPLRYGKAEILNPHFVVCGVPWADLKIG